MASKVDSQTPLTINQPKEPSSSTLDREQQRERKYLVPQAKPIDIHRHQYPSLYQINTRVWLRDLSDTLGRQATLDDISDRELDQLAEKGFDWIWFLGVWQTGTAGRRVSREHPEWQAEFREVLPDLQQGDICGSCFAITHYAVHSDFGGNQALERLYRGSTNADCGCCWTSCPRMDSTAARLRLHIRQAPLRPTSRRTCAARA